MLGWYYPGLKAYKPSGVSSARLVVKMLYERRGFHRLCFMTSQARSGRGRDNPQRPAGLLGHWFAN